MDAALPISHSQSAQKSSSNDEKSSETGDELWTEEALIDDSSSPLWKLFETIQTYIDDNGICISEDDESIEETEDCLSLSVIRKRLVDSFYDYVSEIAEDFNTLWENVKKVNEPSSKLHKSAVELQGVLQNKVQELIGSQCEDLESEENADDEESRKRFETSDSLTERLQALCECLREYLTEDGNQIIFQFMEKPSIKNYPDYYRKVQNPIDMLTIEENIRTDRYSSEQELLDDLKLMFRNYREYFGEKSFFYKHTIMLEKILIDRAQALGVATEKILTILNTPKVEIVRTFIDVPAKNPLADTTIHEIQFSRSRKKRSDAEKGRFKSINGYILFSSVTRKRVKADHPDKNLSFGDVSRMVGLEWKKLSVREKYLWDKKADGLNKQNQAYIDPLRSTTKTKPQVHQWECRWDNCDCVFTNRLDCLDHVISFNEGHLFSTSTRFDYEYHCQWTNCPRNAKGSPPFRSIHQLIRHVKEVHIAKGQISTDPLADRSSSKFSISDPLSFNQLPESLDPFTRRLYSWCNLLLDLRTSGGRQLMLPFIIAKPSIDSYEQIQGPTNISAIIRKISENKYSSELQLVNDLKFMFRNYRKHNVENVTTCKDAELLERVLVDRTRKLGVPFDETLFTEDSVKVERSIKLGADSNFNTSRILEEDTSNKILKANSSSPALLINRTEPNFMKVESTDSFEETYSQSSHVRPSSTSDVKIENTTIIKEEDPPHLLLTSSSSSEQIDRKNVTKIEISDTLNENSSTSSNDVEVLEISDDDVVDSPSSLCIDVDNFIKFETRDKFIRESSSDESSDVVILDTSPSHSLAYNVERVRNEFVNIEATDLLNKDWSMRSSDVDTTRKTFNNGSTTKQQKVGHTLHRKPFNGFILFSREMRRTVSDSFPRMSFGEISRVVGAEWNKLLADEKRAWGDKAIRMSQGDIEQRNEAQKYVEKVSDGQRYWECLWDDCVQVFETKYECLDHAIAERTGHVSTWFMDSNPNANEYRRDRIYQCRWRKCGRIRKGAPPFPSLHRLIRHVREVHILKNPGRILVPLDNNSNISKNSTNFVSDSPPRMCEVLTNDSNDHPMEDYSGQEEEEIFILS